MFISVKVNTFRVYLPLPDRMTVPYTGGRPTLYHHAGLGLEPRTHCLQPHRSHSHVYLHQQGLGGAPQDPGYWTQTTAGGGGGSQVCAETAGQGLCSELDVEEE